MLNWIASMNWMAQLTFLLAVISVLGIALGKLNFKGLSLGIGGVLFAGIFVSHFAFNYNLGFDLNKPEYSGIRTDPVRIRHRYICRSELFCFTEIIWY